MVAIRSLALGSERVAMIPGTAHATLARTVTPGLTRLLDLIEHLVDQRALTRAAIEQQVIAKLGADRAKPFLAEFDSLSNQGIAA